jgi:hypothetical protein
VTEIADRILDAMLSIEERSLNCGTSGKISTPLGEGC